jgi:WD40 repeat protein
MVASISRDGTVRSPRLLSALFADVNDAAAVRVRAQAKVWDYVDGKCIWTMPVADGTCIAWSVDGATLFVGTSHGSISAWTLPAQAGGDATVLAPETYCTPFSGGAAAHGQCRVDCLCMLTRDRLASKSSDGKCCIWDISKPTLAAMVTSFREPGAAKAGANQVGCTPCGSVLLIGSNTGDVSAWSTVDGSKLGTLQGGKARFVLCAAHRQCVD